MDVPSKSKPCVSFEFEVEKILCISSDGNYQVQWRPAWVSKFHLVGCDHLIQEFLLEQAKRGRKSQPAHQTVDSMLQNELCGQISQQQTCTEPKNEIQIDDNTHITIQVPSELNCDGDDTRSLVDMTSDNRSIGPFSKPVFLDAFLDAFLDVFLAQKHLEQLQQQQQQQQEQQHQDVGPLLLLEQEKEQTSSDSIVAPPRTVLGGASGVKKYSLRSRQNDAHTQNKSQSSDKQLDREETTNENQYTRTSSSIDNKSDGPHDNFHLCSVGQTFDNSTNTKTKSKYQGKKRRTNIAFKPSKKKKKEESSSYMKDILNDSQLRDPYLTFVTTEEDTVSHLGQYSSDIPTYIKDGPVPNVDGMSEDDTATSTSCQYELKLEPSQSDLHQSAISRQPKKELTCSICDKVLKGHLKRHMRTHIGAKPFTCSVCGKLYTRSDDLKRHQLDKHNKESPYT